MLGLGLPIPMQNERQGAPVGPTYYVAAPGNGGSDSNPGTLASPWATIPHVTAQTFIAIALTTVLFNGGDTFSGSLAFTTSNAPGGISVGSYGTGQATISSGNSAEGFKATNLGGVKVSNLTFTGGGNTSNTTAGISCINSLAANAKLAGPTITNCLVTAYGGNGIEVKGTNGFAGFNGTTITGNTVHDCTGHVTGGITGFLEGTSGINLFAYPGFAGGQGGTNPSHINFTISNNLVYNCNGVASAGSWTGSGITYFQCQYGLVSGNTVHDFGANVDSGFGAGGIWGGDMDHVVTQFNEVYNGKHGVGGFDGGGFDLDEGTTNCIVQYNWAHDNSGNGYLMDANVDGSLTQWGGNTIRFNISQNNLAEILIAATGDMTAASYVYNNTCYPAPGGTALKRAGTNLATVTVANNIFYAARSGDTLISIPSPSSIVLAGNSYYSTLNGSAGAFSLSWNGTTYTTFAAWQTATGQEKIAGVNVGLTSNPKIYVPGGGFVTGGYSAQQMMAYNLQSGSPMVGAGLNLTTLYGISPGSTDFCGVAISAASLPVGAVAGDFQTFAASSTAATNFLARVSSFSKLDNVVYNSMLSGLSSDGILSLIDILYWMAAPNTAASLLNLVSASFSLTSHGGTSFAANQGILGDGSTGYLDTGWVPSTNGVNFTLTSGSHSFYGLTNGLSDGKADYGLLNSAHTSETSSYSGTGGYYADVNDVSGNTDATTFSNGCFLMNRSGTALKNWVNGLNTGTRTVSAIALPNQNLIALASNKGTGSGIIAADFKATRMAALMFGSGSIDAAAFTRRLQSSAQAYGINTY